MVDIRFNTRVEPPRRVPQLEPRRRRAICKMLLGWPKPLRLAGSEETGAGRRNRLPHRESPWIAGGSQTDVGLV
jgi:hypothetical protein